MAARNVGEAQRAATILGGINNHSIHRIVQGDVVVTCT